MTEPVDFARANAARAELGRVVAEHPELTDPAARTRFADWLENEENPMRKKDDEERLDTTIGVRLAPGDLVRLDALTARVRVASRTTIARSALLLGLAALEADPSQLFAPEPTKPTKRKR